MFRHLDVRAEPGARGSVSNRLDVGSGVRTREIIVADINVSVKALPPNQSLAGARYQREGYAEKVLMGTYRDPEGERIHFREIVQFCHLVGSQSDGGV